MNLTYIVGILLVILGLYCIMTKKNCIKIALGLTLLGDGINLFWISLGYRFEGVSPIITPRFFENVSEFAQIAVDPLPQVIVLTAIVINISLVAVILGLAIRIYELYGTLDTREIRRLRH